MNIGSSCWIRKSRKKQTYAKNGKIYTFRVPDERQNEFSFFYTADLQFPLQRQKQLLNLLLKAANASDCDFYVLGGDICIAFSSKDLFRGVLTQLSQFGGEKQPIVMLRGNHELRGKEADRYLYYFGNEEGVSYGIFRFGDTAFLVLDCWEDKPAESPGAHYIKYNLDSLFLKKNKEFLKKALASEKWTSATRRIVLAHGAPYSTFDACMWMPFNLQKLTDPYFGGRNPESRLNLWLAGHAFDTIPNREFNLYQDVPASRVIFESGVPLVLIPCCGVAEILMMTLPELKKRTASCGSLGAFLYERTAEFLGNDPTIQKVIWDIAAIACFDCPEAVHSRVISAPVLNPDASWTLTEDRHKIRLVHYLERGRIFNRLFERLESFARS